MRETSRYILLGISSGVLLLGGCANRTEEVATISESIDTQASEIVSQLNALSKTETDLQPAFETTLAEDEDLSSLGDGSSDVFANIDTRKETLQTIEEQTSNLGEHYAALTEENNQELPEAELKAVSDSLEKAAQSLQEFTAHYSSSLENQTHFFESLAGEDASYETMANGIEAVSGEDEQSKQQLLDLDETLSALEEANTTLLSTLKEQPDSN